MIIPDAEDQAYCTTHVKHSQLVVQGQTLRFADRNSYLRCQIVLY